MGDKVEPADGLHPDARVEHDALTVRDDASIDVALADFWRMYSDVWDDPRLLRGLEELQPSYPHHDVRFFALEAFPDRHGVIAIIGVKNERMLALAFEECTYGISEGLWRDARTTALTRATPRAIVLSADERG